LPLIYASDLAEQRIKHEISEADDNVFRKGFIVDVNVETRGGRPVAYRIANLHQVIELPDDDESPPALQKTHTPLLG
jgi:predicted  nucleic acid-binding Zn ribbon protein